MTMTTKKSLLVLAFASYVDAFVPAGAGVRRTGSALNLVPEQGSQLVAASCAFLAHQQADEDENDIAAVAADDKLTPTNAGRSLITRIFSRQSYEGMDSPDNHHHGGGILSSFLPHYFGHHEAIDHEDDVTYFPVCGFRWVAIGEGPHAEYRVLPTTESAACPLRKKSTEDVVGWFAPACQLGPLDDDWGYAHVEEDTPESGHFE